VIRAFALFLGAVLDNAKKVLSWEACRRVV